ncbi:5,10-methylenetetrahydromethanopterin reductase [Halosimplex salinum]|uniref:5,10-methylenetetrahydromethanopterin reductase n=1 Tax=Halosimplex salinum TaxID=1710538 RepID=UPI000F48395B|nr:5,10-methylenetetrahydromethanopterin reductase [Halosimplex salinum]
MRAVELTPEHPVSTLAGFGETAEAAGFDAAFVSHHYNNRDQFAALTAIAAETDDILVGPGVANPYETHPVTLASRMATLDEYSGGRGVFGVGPGDASTLANLGVDPDTPLRRVLETFKIAQRLWAGERVDHDGTFTADDAGLNYDVGSIPVYVGAQGPHMTRMASKHADGVLYNGAHPRDYEWASERVAEGLDERPDDRGEFDFAAYASVSVAEDAAAARETARFPVAFVAGGAPPPVLSRHDIDAEAAAAVSDAVSSGEFREAAERVTESMLDAFCIAGTPEQVEAEIDAVLEYADSFVAASPLGPDVERAIELLGENHTA